MSRIHQIQALINQELFQPITPEEKVNLQLGLDYNWLGRFRLTLRNIHYYERLNEIQKESYRLRCKCTHCLSTGFSCVCIIICITFLVTGQTECVVAWILCILLWILRITHACLCIYMWVLKIMIKKESQTIQSVYIEFMTRLPIIFKKVEAEEQTRHRRRQLANRPARA